MTRPHTQLPWIYRFRAQGTTIERVSPAEMIALVPSLPGRSDVDGNARFIVQACNAHEELLARCKECATL